MNYQTYLFFEGRTEYVQGYDTPQHTYPLGSLVFGAFSVLQLYIPRNILPLPNAFYVMLPFLITAIVLIITSMRKSKKHAQPAGCGVNYFREER